MPDLPIDHPKFLAAYAAASGLAPRVETRTGSIAAAIIAYKASSSYKAQAENTRAQRRPFLDQFLEAYDPGRRVDLTERHIRADLDKFEGHPRNNRLKAWKALLSWAAEIEKLIPENPAERLKKVKTAASDGHVPWDEDQIEAFRKRWPIGSRERLAFELIYWTGARVSDAIRLGPGNVDKDGWLVFCQQKTEGEVSIPFKRQLPEFAEGMSSDLDHLHASIDALSIKHMTFMVTVHGASRSAKAVSQWFAGKARDARIKDRSAHGLRKSRTIALIEAEATTHQVGAWTGHESLAEIERYGKKFRRRKALSSTKEERKSSNSSEKVPKEAGK